MSAASTRPVLQDRTPPGPPAPDSARADALDLASQLCTPEAVTLERAASILGELRGTAKGSNALTMAFDADVAGPGVLVRARDAAQFALDLADQIASASADDRRRVEADPDLSPSGREKRLAAYREQRGKEFAEKVAGHLAKAEQQLDERAAALGQRWSKVGSATQAPTEAQQLLAALRVNTLVSIAGRNNERLGELVLSVADAGDAGTAAELLSVFARTATDRLRLQATTAALRARLDAVRRTELLGDTERLKLAAERLLVDRARSGLGQLASFLKAHPGEVGLARQQLEKIFASFEGE